MLIRFLLYGLLGWALEVTWTSLGNLLPGRRTDWTLPGKTYLWMFPVYGLGGLLLEPAYPRVVGLPWLLRGPVWVLLIFAVEYATGWLLSRLLGRCPWDYSGTRFSIHGYIRLDYAPAWLVVGFLFERLYPVLLELTPYIAAAVSS